MSISTVMDGDPTKNLQLDGKRALNKSKLDPGIKSTINKRGQIKTFQKTKIPRIKI